MYKIILLLLFGGVSGFAAEMRIMNFMNSDIFVLVAGDNAQILFCPKHSTSATVVPAGFYAGTYMRYDSGDNYGLDNLDTGGVWFNDFPLAEDQAVVLVFSSGYTGLDVPSVNVSRYFVKLALVAGAVPFNYANCIYAFMAGFCSLAPFLCFGAVRKMFEEVET